MKDTSWSVCQCFTVSSSIHLDAIWSTFGVYFFPVAAKHTETKQFYILYNTLDDTKLYLSKEVCFINNYPIKKIYLLLIFCSHEF